MLKKFLSLLLGLAVLCVFLYSAVWFYSAGKLNTVLDEFYARNDQSDLALYGTPPTVKGFPFTPQATFTKGLNYKGIDFMFAEMRVEGYGLGGAPVTISFPEGLQVGSADQPNIVTLSFLETTISAPNGLPELYEEDLSEWQGRGSAVDVQHYKAQLGSVDMTGDGVVTLDQNLQPLVTLNTTATGYEELLASLEASGSLSKAAHAGARLALDALATEDPETGTKEINIPVMIQYQKLNIGPLMIFEFPEIYWDTRTQPALLQ